MRGLFAPPHSVFLLLAENRYLYLAESLLPSSIDSYLQSTNRYENKTSLGIGDIEIAVYCPARSVGRRERSRKGRRVAPSCTVDPIKEARVACLCQSQPSAVFHAPYPYASQPRFAPRLTPTLVCSVLSLDPSFVLLVRPGVVTSPFFHKPYFFTSLRSTLSYLFLIFERFFSFLIAFYSLCPFNN